MKNYMKNLAIFFALLVGNSAFAGYMKMTCSAYRISQDTNKNVQTFSYGPDGNVSINNVKLTEEDLIDGSIYGVYPGYPSEAKYKSKDGNGDYSISISALSEVVTVQGHVNIGRDHDVEVYKVAAKVSRNNKTHEFIGTCTNEVVSTCGGACEDESEVRDEL